MSMNKWWSKAKKQGQKTKLRGQIHLAQREITARKKKFGVELYDLLTNDKEKLLGVSAGTIFREQSPDELRIPFERARDDIEAMQSRKDTKQRQMDTLEIKGHHTMPDTTLADKAKKSAQQIADGSVQTKIKAQMALIDREMKIRKEKFGVEVFDIAVSTTSTTKTASAENGEPSTGGGGAIMDDSQSEQENEIQQLIDTAKMDIATIEGKQNSFQRDIGMIDEEMQPLSQQQQQIDGSYFEDDGGSSNTFN